MRTVAICSRSASAAYFAAPLSKCEKNRCSGFTRLSSAGWLAFKRLAQREVRDLQPAEIRDVFTIRQLAVTLSMSTAT